MANQWRMFMNTIFVKSLALTFADKWKYRLVFLALPPCDSAPPYWWLVLFIVNVINSSSL